MKNQLITEDWITDIDFDKKDGMDLNRDILKIAVAERHKNTGHKCIGFISGTGMKRGAAASSIAHDSHNLIIIGTNEADMAAAGNRVREMGGGCAATADGNILAELPLPVSGLMSDASAPAVAEQNQKLWESERLLGVPGDVELFMLMAFTSLPVIPHLKITTQGLVDVDRQRIVPLCE